MYSRRILRFFAIFFISISSILIPLVYFLNYYYRLKLDKQAPLEPFTIERVELFLFLSQYAFLLVGALLVIKNKPYNNYVFLVALLVNLTIGLKDVFLKAGYNIFKINILVMAIYCVLHGIPILLLVRNIFIKHKAGGGLIKGFSKH